MLNMWNTKPEDDWQDLKEKIVHTYHIFDYARCNNSVAGQAIGTINFREGVGSARGIKIDQVIIPACAATAANTAIMLSTDLLNATPSCFTNGIPSNNCLLIPSPGGAGNIAFDNPSEEWHRWGTLQHITSMTFSLKNIAGNILTIPAAPYSFQIGFYVEHVFCSY